MLKTVEILLGAAGLAADNTTVEALQAVGLTSIQASVNTEKNVKSGEVVYQSQLTPRDTRVSSVVKTLPIPKKRPEMAMSVIGTSIAFPND